MENERKEGITIGDLFSAMWYKKWLGLIIAGVLFLLVALAFVFVVNRGNAKYVVKFNYENVPFLSGNKYLDGTSFNYKDIIRYDEVVKIKESNPKFSSVDVEDMFENDNISIKEIKVLTDERDPNSMIKDQYFELSISKKYFKKLKDAKQFISDLIYVPIERTNKMISELKYDANFDLIESSKTFNLVLENINQQVGLILNGYDQLIKMYGDVTLYLKPNFEVSNENSNTQYTISQLKDKLNNILEYHKYYSMQAELNSQGYVKNAEYEKKYLIERISSLEIANQDIDKKINILQTELDKILTFNNKDNIIIIESIQNLVEDIRVLTNNKANNVVEIDVLQRKLNNLGNVEGSKNFEKRINDLVEDLKRETITYTNVAKYLYGRDINITTHNTNMINLEGSISIVVIAIISAFVGLFVGGVVSCIVGYNTKKRKLEISTK